MRPSGVEIGILLGVAAVYVMVFARMGIPEERTHLIEYGVLAILAYEALEERASQGRRVFVPPLLAVLVVSLAGILDEVIQGVLPNRVFDPVDMGFNFLAATLAVVAGIALGWTRRRASG